MTDDLTKSCTAFQGERQLAAGAVADVALAVKAAVERGERETILVFEDDTGREIDFDIRGDASQVVERLRTSLASSQQDDANGGSSDQFSSTRGPGRPKLGVVAREVTLLPRHWDWLAKQPGGASATLRRLVDETRRSGNNARQQRVARDAAYRFMSAMAGNRPGFEEAARALYAEDRAAFEHQISSWPVDIRDYARQLAYGACVIGSRAK